MFDGVHLGHRFVLDRVTACARERGLSSMAVTFDHTLHREQVLTPLGEKCRLLAEAGVDRTEVVPFTAQLRQMTAREFMGQVLRDRLHVRVLLTGYDNRFGHNRTEGFDDYVRYGRELGMLVASLPPAPPVGGETVVSSSLIRQLIGEGRVAQAARCLGRPYRVSGCVEHGDHIGTGLGFPTANVVPDEPCQLIPGPGVYAVTVRLEDHAEELHGMMNIGYRPTFDGRRMTQEVHIFRLDEDLYGRRLTVSFVGRLRDERRFDTPDALQQQLQQDALQAEQILTVKE